MHLQLDGIDELQTSGLGRLAAWIIVCGDAKKVVWKVAEMSWG